MVAVGTINVMVTGVEAPACEPQITRARYCVVWVGVAVCVRPVAPAIFVQVVPLVEACHWYVISGKVAEPVSERFTLVGPQMVATSAIVLPAAGALVQPEPALMANTFRVASVPGL